MEVINVEMQGSCMYKVLTTLGTLYVDRQEFLSAGIYGGTLEENMQEYLEEERML